jgi:RiboL-PSP-HEPN
MSDREIMRYKRQLDDLFDKVSTLNSDPEMQSHWARYLCVRISGFIEVAVSTIYKNYAKNKASPSVANYVEKQLSGFQNPKMEKILGITKSFNPEWETEIKLELENNSEIKDSIDSIVDLRNKISHGDNSNSSLTYIKIKKYYENALKLINLLEEQCKE